MDVQEPEDLEEDVDLDIIRRIASEEDDPSSNREEEESESSEESSSSEEEEEEDQNIIILRQGEFQSHAKGARRRKTNTFFHKPKPTSSPRGKGTVQLIQNLTTNVHSLRFKNFSVENPDSIGLYVVLVRDSGGQAFDVTNVRHLRELETRSVVLHLDLGLQGQVRGARVNDHQGSFFEQSLALANPLDVSHVLIAKPATARPATVVPDVHCLASLQVYVEPVPVQVQAHVRRKTTQLQAQWWKVQQSQQPLMILDEHTIETEASKIFRRADADESGTVDFHEFWKMLEQYGLTVLEPQARRFFRLCDRLGEGEMDQEDFQLALYVTLSLQEQERTCGGPQSSKKKKKNSKKKPMLLPSDIFMIYDEDRDSLINEYEYIHAMKMMLQTANVDPQLLHEYFYDQCTSSGSSREPNSRNNPRYKTPRPGHMTQRQFLHAFVEFCDEELELSHRGVEFQPNKALVLKRKAEAKRCKKKEKRGNQGRQRLPLALVQLVKRIHKPKIQNQKTQTRTNLATHVNKRLLLEHLRTSERREMDRAEQARAKMERFQRAKARTLEADVRASRHAHAQSELMMKTNQALDERQAKIQAKRDRAKLNRERREERAFRDDIEAQGRAREAFVAQAKTQALTLEREAKRHRRELEREDRLELTAGRWSTIPPRLYRGQEAIAQLGYILAFDCRENRGLSTLPPELCYHLDAVVRVDLSDNRLEALPPEVESWKSCLELYVQGNALTRLSPVILSQGALEVLDCSRNAITTLDLGSGSSSSSSSSSLGSNLHILKGSDNTMTKLIVPGPQPKLYYVDVSKNQLERIPETLGRYCLALEHLDMSYNHLRQLNSTWSGNNNNSVPLRGLYLQHNRLRQFPPGFLLACVQLQVLEVQYNAILTLPRTIGSCTELVSLDLSHNSLRFLPRELGSCVNLEVLNLDANDLRTLPPQVGLLTRLTRLSVRQNALTGICPEVGACVELRKLDFARNDCHDLPHELGFCAQLEQLDGSYNHLSELPVTLGQLLGHLTHLNLAHNVLSGPSISEALESCSPFEASTLTELRLNHNRLSEFPPSLCLSLESRGDTGETPSANHRCRFPHLCILDLAANRIAYLPHTMSNLVMTDDCQLSRLDLYNNLIMHLPLCFDTIITHVPEVHLDRNPILTFIQRFEHVFEDTKNPNQSSSRQVKNENQMRIRDWVVDQALYYPSLARVWQDTENVDLMMTVESFIRLVRQDMGEHMWQGRLDGLLRKWFWLLKRELRHVPALDRPPTAEEADVLDTWTREHLKLTEKSLEETKRLEEARAKTYNIVTETDLDPVTRSRVYETHRREKERETLAHYRAQVQDRVEAQDERTDMYQRRKRKTLANEVKQVILDRRRDKPPQDVQDAQDYRWKLYRRTGYLLDKA